MWCLLEVHRVTDHLRHKMHANSMAAWLRLQAAGEIDQRELQVLNYIELHAGSTDHQVRDGLGFPERNDVSPAITRLKQEGLLEEGEKVMGESGFRRRTLYLAGTAPDPRQGGLF